MRLYRFWALTLAGCACRLAWSAHGQPPPPRRRARTAGHRGFPAVGRERRHKLLPLKVVPSHALNFGPHAVGSTTSRRVTATNTGDAPAFISVIGVSSESGTFG